MDGVSGGRKDRGGGGNVRDRYGDILSCWEDNISQLSLGAEPNVPLAYAPGL